MMIEVNLEFGPTDVRPLLAGNMQMIILKAKRRQRLLQAVEVHAQVKQRADEHVATDPAEEVEIERFHESRSRPWFPEQHQRLAGPFLCVSGARRRPGAAGVSAASALIWLAA